MKKNLNKILILFFATLTIGFSQNNYSLSFDGVDDYVKISSGDDFNVSDDQELTISAYVKTNENGYLFNAEFSFGYYFYISQSSELALWYNGTGNGCGANTDIRDGNWHHVVASYDGNSIKIYIDGQLDNNCENMGSLESRDGSIDITIGNRPGSTHFNGGIDEVSIWNKALTQEQIENTIQVELNGDEDGLIGYWNFNDGQGSTLTDLSGSDNDGIIYGAIWSDDVPILPTPPVIGGNNSLSFDGVDDYVEIDDADILDGMNNLTLQTWIKFNSYNDYSGEEKAYNLISKQQYGANANAGISYALYTHHDANQLTFLIRTNQNQQKGANLFDYESFINLDQWHHIAGVYDGSFVYLYIDGNLVAQSDVINGEILETGYPLRIASNLGLDRIAFFDGSFDNTSILSTALSSDEIQNHMNISLSGEEQNLVGYWNFNEGDGTTFSDLSSNENNGTVYGATWSGDGAPVEAPVFGCTDPYAENYASEANSDDGSCEYPDNGNYALSFNEPEDYIELSENGLGSGNGNFTVLFKIKTEDLNNNGAVLQSGDRSTSDFHIYYYQNNLYVGTYNSFANQTAIPFEGYMNNEWNNLAITWDGSAMATFLNGEIAEVIYPPYNATDGTMSIGKDLGSGGSGSGDFEIDELQIWNQALDNAEIQSFPNNNLNDYGLVGYWKMDSGENEILYDHSGNQNHGTIVGATWEEVISGCTDPYAENYASEANSDDGSCSGYPNNGDYSLYFDRDLVNVGEIGDYSSQVTVMGWVRTTDDQSYHAIMSGDCGNIMLTMHGGKILFGSQCSSPIQHDTYGTTDINNGEWYHVAATYDEYGGENNLKVYVNGNLEGQSTKSGQFSGATGNFAIGSRSGGGEYINGNLDMVRIWKTALTQDQIKENMLSVNALVDDGLLADWQVSAGEGNILYDHSGNGNHGSIDGASYFGEFPSFGCTDPYAENYDPEADVDDGDCSGYPDNGEYALSFGASQDHVDLGSNMDSDEEFSIATWVYIDENIIPLNGQRTFINKVNSSNGDKSIFLGSYQSKIGFTILTGEQSNIMYGSNNQNGSLGFTETPLVPGWQHIGAVFTGDSMLVYINGELDANVVVFQNPGSVNDYDNSVWHMADVLGGSGNVGGKISSMSLWSKPLQQYDIQNLMSESPDPLSSGLMGMWKFAEGEGSLLHDHSGNGNHGAITGATWSDDVPYVGPEWFVSTSGDDSNIGSLDEPFATIQHAINAAHNGHIVLVSPGTYTENINYNGRNILVISEMGPSETIIDGGQNGSVVTFNSGETDAATLDGFTITNGLTENGNGGGIFIDNSSPSIFNVIVENNHANSGGGIDLKGETQTVISNSIIRNNSAEWGAGIYCHSNSPTIENVVVSGNHATVNAGGVYAREYASPIIINCTIVNNSTDGQGGGILTWFNSTVDVKNSIIRDNFPNELGHVSGGSVTLNYSNISGNHEGFSGSNNINADPMFCNQSNNDFRIAQDSPCFGAGESGIDIGAMFDGDYCQEAFVNNSLSFDGVDDNVELANRPITGNVDAFTILTSFKTNRLNSDQQIIYEQCGSYKDLKLSLNSNYHDSENPNSDYTLGFHLAVSQGGQGHAYAPVESISENTWHKAAIVWDGAYVHIYVDSVLVSTINYNIGGSFDMDAAPEDGHIGLGCVDNLPFDGNLDEISFWDRALTNEELLLYMSEPPSGNEENLSSYYNFDEGEGTTLTDLSGNGNNGIINGASWDNYGAPIGPTGGENNELDINGRLSGIISESSNNALLESAHIIAISEDNSFSAEAYSDINGEYSLDLVGSLNYFVNISYEGLVDHNEYLYVAPFEEASLNVSLNVLEDAIVEGTVTDWYTNTPLASASVLLAYTDEEMETIESMTDENGYFMVQVPGEKDYDLFVYADGYWVEHDAFFLSSGSQQEITVGIAEMSSASRLYGTIKDIETNELIPYAEIQLNCDQASDWDHTGALGTYRLFNYYSGDCNDGVLIVSASGYETSVQSASDIAFEAGSSYEMDITLMQGDDPDPGMITGTVFSNIDQSTIGSATINAYNVNTTQLFSIETSEEGSYQLFLPESEYYISITANNHEELLDTLSVVSGQSFVRDFYLDEVYLNTVSGIVADPNGNGLFDMEVFVAPEGERYTIASTFTNESGEYTVQVPNGRYDFGAGNTNYYMTFEYSVELSGSDQNIDFTLAPVAQFDGGFAGLVHLNEGDNSTVWLNIWNSDLTYQAYISSDENGAYTLPLINGTYSLYAWVPGSNYQSVYVPNAFTIEDNVINYDIYFVAPDAPEPPTIVFLEDVLNDQGGQLELAWTPGDPREYEIFPQYSIWRMDEEWNLISTVPYRGSDVYSMVVPTLGDSTQEGIFESTFMVTAHTINENIFYDSDPVTSYSIDNIFPGIPQQLVASFSGEVVDLNWVHSEAEDLSHYNLYRQNVIAGGSATIISMETNFYSDNVNQSGEFEYWVTAVDVSGNESDPSNAAMVTLGVDEGVIPMEFALLQNYPNPFNPSTQIMYTLPNTSAVEIVIYDMLGSKVRTLFSGSQDAGYKNVLWNATNEKGDPVSAGMYIYTIEANGFFASKKMILLK